MIEQYSVHYPDGIGDLKQEPDKQEKALPEISVIVHETPGLATVAFTIKATVVEPKYVGDGPARTVRVEDLIEQIVKGLEVAHRRAPLKSRAQALAITKLEEAVHWLRARPEAKS